VPSNIQRVLSHISEDLKRNRVQLYEFIRDFDRLRTGIIQNSHMANALNMARINCTEEELALIFSHFAADRNRIRYTLFLEAVGDHVPLVDASVPQTSQISDHESWYDIIEEFRRVMKVKNMAIKPAF
jgi:hypothetical protein